MPKFITKYTSDYNAGRNHPKFIVLHHTGGNKLGDISTLDHGGGRKVSIHYYITQKGEVYRFLPHSLGANHVGYATYKGNGGYWCNTHSIGIELENLGNEEYPWVQLVALDEVLKWIDKVEGRRLPIVGHREIDKRKVDPGKTFPMNTYKKYRQHKKKNIFRRALEKVTRPKRPTLLKKGDSGWWVKKVQQALRKRGYYGGLIDGDFGPMTKAAVIRFQRSRGLGAEGIVGKKTFKALGL